MSEKDLLEEMINQIEGFLVGDLPLKKLDSQLIAFYNTKSKVPVFQNIRALLKRILTNKHQEVKQPYDE